MTKDNNYQLTKDMLSRLCFSTALYDHDSLAQCQPVLGLLLESTTELLGAENGSESAKRLTCMNTTRTSSQVAQRCSVRLPAESLSKLCGDSGWLRMMSMSCSITASAAIVLFTSGELMRVAVFPMPV